MNNIIKDQLKEYDLDNIHDIKYPFAEILQKIILSCLSKIGFFKECVFHGGTSLRIFYDLNRFSEDLDFSLKPSIKSFSLVKYANQLIEALKSFGLAFEISKHNEANVQMCMLSINLYELVKEYSDEKYLKNIRPNQTLKIKLEVDTNTPQFSLSDIEQKILYTPLFSVVSIFKLPTLFAGKLNALLTRPVDKTGAKGRDYYDYLFYMSKHISPNLKYLQSSLAQFKLWNKDKEFKLAYLKDLLSNNFKKVNINEIKQDVYPLIKYPNELKDWSNDLFLLTLKDLK